MTKEQKVFINAVNNNIEYWSNVKLDEKYDTLKYRLEGLAFSILTTIDGCSGTNNFVGYDLVNKENGIVVNRNVELHDLI